MTASQIMKKVLKLSKNNFRTSGIKQTELVHEYLKWENTSIWDIACQLAWLESQVGFVINTYVDADGTLVFGYASEQQTGYSFSSVFDYTEDYDSSDLITASRVTYNGKTLANVTASSGLVAKWGYVSEIEECQAETGGAGSNSKTSTKSSGKLRDDAQIKKYNIPSDIVNQALKVAKEGNTPKANLKLIYEWCNKNIGYTFYYNTRYGASGTLKKRTGNCCDNAHVMIGMARSVGIKARYCHAKAGKKGHVYGEYYVDGGWIVIDTGTSSTTKYYGGHSNYAGGTDSRYDKLPF